MVVMIMRAAVVSGTLTLSLYLLSPFPGFCHVNPSSSPGTQVLLSAISKRRKGHHERKVCWGGGDPGKSHHLFLPQFPLLHRGLTPAHLSSLQVVVRVKQDSRHVVKCKQLPELTV